MRKFDYSFLENGMIPAKLVNITAKIYSANTFSILREKDNLKAYENLISPCFVNNVKFASKLDNIELSDKRLFELINGNKTALSSNDEHIIGYTEGLNKIVKDYSSMAIDKKTTDELHSLIINKYRNSVFYTTKTENDDIKYVNINAVDIPVYLDDMFTAFNKAWNNENINKLLLIPCVILDFICINPYGFLNKAITSLLSNLMLYKTEFHIVKYISLDEKLFKYKNIYDAILNDSIAGWEHGLNDYPSFIYFYLSMIYKCYNELDNKFMVLDKEKLTKRGRIMSTVLNSDIPLSKAEIALILPDISPTTIELILGQMVREGLVRKLGNTKSVRYLRP